MSVIEKSIVLIIVIGVSASVGGFFITKWKLEESAASLEDSIEYKIVTVEGKRFVATESAYGYWNLAGPID